MQLRTFMLPTHGDQQTEDELNRFLRSHRVLQVERHFCADNGGYWALLVEYVDGDPVVRYMDDVLLLSHSHDELMTNVRSYTNYLHQQLLLDTHSPVVNRTSRGIPFLGYVVYGNGLRLNRRSKLRFGQRMEYLSGLLYNGEIEEKEFASRATCLMAFVSKARTEGFRRQQAARQGLHLQGL